MKSIGMCFRCEYRARFLETGSAPRCECGEINRQSFCCYMYTPCTPLILKKESKDKRSISAPSMIRARSRVIGKALSSIDVSGTRKKPHVQLVISPIGRHGEYMIVWEKARDGK
jgi:hypothetical protein